jgi:hypothetical protein
MQSKEVCRDHSPKGLTKRVWRGDLEARGRSSWSKGSRKGSFEKIIKKLIRLSFNKL